MDDALSRLLHDVRPHGVLLDESVLNPPWSLRFAEGAPLSLVVALRGSAWVTPEGGAPVRLPTASVVIVRGPEPYAIADGPDTAPLAVVHGADRCTTPDGRPAVDGPLPMCGDGARPEGATVLLKATYQVRGSVTERVLAALPRIALVPAPPEGCPTFDMISRELRRSAPGQQVVLDRLLDLLLVASLREWFELSDTHTPTWYRAHRDPVVGPVLRLMHDDPARPWTVAGLAAEASTSRATFAQRFTELVGQPPMTYLTEWRIRTAADLLTRTEDTVEAVARRVGYSNAYALSVAFKRTLGVRPSEHRARSRGAAEATGRVGVAGAVGADGAVGVAGAVGMADLVATASPVGA
ncbi:cupin domain-containing protein [Streptomyces sp. 796.1]|uniref:AraC family transcriptional regulator n=1 Tax=Streptomyces sp. 796.1 TaxID=3163029 RepID=UPI0039C8DEE3